MSESYDLVVLGSGPGGYVAAIRAAQLGLKTAIVERELLGGICLNWGCIPTKALLRSSEIYHHLKHAGDFGLAADNVRADLDAVVKRSRGVARQLNQGVAYLMKKNKVDVHMGVGVIEAPGRLRVTSGEGVVIKLAAADIIIATGARARDLPFAPDDGDRVWTYRSALNPPAMPSNLLVIGSGAIGVEFASFYSDMGAKVMIVEALDRIVSLEDKDVSAHLEKAFKRQGIELRTSSRVEQLDADAGGVRVRLTANDGAVEELVVSHVVVAIGVIPNTENIGLEALGVETVRGHIKADGYCRTNVKGIWAIGDVTAPPWLAHKAMHEAVIAVEAIAGEKPLEMDTRNIPACTYCRPQIASIGLTEAKAREAGYDIKIGTFPFIGNGKAIALGEAEGFVKTVFEARSGRLLGAHMVGAEVTELIRGSRSARRANSPRAISSRLSSLIRPSAKRCTRAFWRPLAGRFTSSRRT